MRLGVYLGDFRPMEEVASDNSTRVVPDEGGPALVVAASRAWRFPNVFPNRAWREPNLQLEPKFIGDPLFAPGQIFGCYSTNQATHLCRYRWPADWSRFPTPEAAEGSSMPADQGRWFNNYQSTAPVEEVGKLGQDEPISSSRWGGFFLALLK